MDASSAVDVDALNPSDLGIIHMIGCGGAGMSSVMRFLLDRGAQVSGSEVRDWPALDSLRRAGATIYRTHDESNLDGVDTVIYPTGLPADNIEFSEARKRHLTILHRSQGLTAGTMTSRP